MKKSKRGRAFVGDIIVTNDKFRPKNKLGKLINIEGNSYKGMIVQRTGDNYFVRFGKGLEFTNPLNGLLGKPVGYVLGRDDFDIDDEV